MSPLGDRAWDLSFLCLPLKLNFLLPGPPDPTALTKLLLCPLSPRGVQPGLLVFSPVAWCGGAPAHSQPSACWEPRVLQRPPWSRPLPHPLPRYPQCLPSLHGESVLLGHKIGQLFSTSQRGGARTGEFCRRRAPGHGGVGVWGGVSPWNGGSRSMWVGAGV